MTSLLARPLPDYLAPGLDIVFVGCNPGLYSARVGHYFANPVNRFWKALNRSGLVSRTVGPADDSSLLAEGIGLTDLVTRPTRNAAVLTRKDFLRDVPKLKQALERCQPRVVCFHGISVYRWYLRYAEGVRERPVLGLQPRTIGGSRVFVAPSPSPLNFHASLEDIVRAYRSVKRYATAKAAKNTAARAVSRVESREGRSSAGKRV